MQEKETSQEVQQLNLGCAEVNEQAKKCSNLIRAVQEKQSGPRGCKARVQQSIHCRLAD